MRCFAAVRVSAPLRGLIVQVQSALRQADADVRWVDEANLHLTLKFLGDLAGEQLVRLRDLCSAEAGRWSRFPLTHAGIGSFPEQGAPRVLWTGCAGDLAPLAGLAAAVGRHAETVGVPPERHPFVAHLTIGRVKSNRNVKRLQAAVEAHRQAALGTDEVGDFVLFRSTLTSRGPVYEELASFPFAGLR